MHTFKALAPHALPALMDSGLPLIHPSFPVPSLSPTDRAWLWPCPSHMSLPRNPCGVRGWAHPSHLTLAFFVLPCSLGDPALAEGPCRRAGVSLIYHDRRVSWGGPLTAHLARQGMGWISGWSLHQQVPHWFLFLSSSVRMEKKTGRPPGRREGPPLSPDSCRPSGGGEAPGSPGQAPPSRPWPQLLEGRGPVTKGAAGKHTPQSSRPRAVPAGWNLGWVLTHSDPWGLAVVRPCCSRPAF